MGGHTRGTFVQHGETCSNGILGVAFRGAGKVGREAILVS
jgi:hypothetical protein